MSLNMNLHRGLVFKKVYFIFLFLFGCLLTFLIPPFQKNDEVSHYYRTIALKNGGFVCGDTNGFSIPGESYLLPDKLAFSSVLFQKGKFPKKVVFEKDSMMVDNEKEFEVTSVCNLTFFGYIPNFVGVWLSSVFFKNVIISFYIGRLFGLIFFISSLYLSVSFIDKNYRNILYVYGLLPMVIHQVSAFTYDVLIFCLIPIIFSIFINDFLTVTSLKYNHKNFFVFSFLILFLSMVKIVYLPLFFFYLVVNLKWFFRLKDKSKRIRYFLVCFFVYLSVILLSFFVSNLLVLKVGSTYPNLVNPSLQKEILVHDPIYFIQVLLKTVCSNWEFYFKTFIGVYGWMDSPLNNTLIFYSFFTLFVILIYRISSKFRKITWLELFFFLLSLMIVLFLIFLSMYLVYTPVADTEILGVQGRYILVLFPFLILFFGFLVGKFRSFALNHNFFIFLTFSIFIFLVSVESIFSRYYDYSKNYEDSSVLENIIESVSKKDKISEILIDKPANFVIDMEVPDYKVSTFQYYINNQNERILVPYKFQIMDSHCQEELKRGYLKQTDLQSSGIVLQFFGKLKVTEDKLCIILSPVFVPSDYKTGFLKLKTINDDPMIKFLYLSK